MRNGHQEKDLHYIKHKEIKMPRAKKKTTTKKRTERKTTKRKGTDTKVIYPGDTFWTKVINGMKKLLSPAFPK